MPGGPKPKPAPMPPPNSKPREEEIPSLSLIRQVTDVLQKLHLRGQFRNGRKLGKYKGDFHKFSYSDLLRDGRMENSRVHRKALGLVLDDPDFQAWCQATLPNHHKDENPQPHQRIRPEESSSQPPRQLAVPQVPKSDMSNSQLSHRWTSKQPLMAPAPPHPQAQAGGGVYAQPNFFPQPRKPEHMQLHPQAFEERGGPYHNRFGGFGTFADQRPIQPPPPPAHHAFQHWGKNFQAKPFQAVQPRSQFQCRAPAPVPRPPQQGSQYSWNATRLQEGRFRSRFASPAAAATPQADIDREAREEEANMRRKKLEEIEKTKETLEKNIETRAKARQLQKKLQKSSSCRESSPADAAEYEKPAAKEQAHKPDHPSTMERPLNADLLLNKDDLRLIGTQNPSAPAQSKEDQPDCGNGGSDDDGEGAERVGDRLASYAEVVDKNMAAAAREEPQKRVANKPLWTDPEEWAKRKKRAEEKAAERQQRKRRLSERENDYEEERCTKRRGKSGETGDGSSGGGARKIEYSRLMERMKKTILCKDKDYLDKLVHCPLGLKRVQLGTLLHEHHESVKERLSRLRFQGAGDKSDARRSADAALDADTILAEIDDLESQSRSLQEFAHASDIPDAFCRMIEDFVRTSASAAPPHAAAAAAAAESSASSPAASSSGADDSDDDIVEVPVPPKPPAPVVTLDGDGSEDDAKSDGEQEEPSTKQAGRESNRSSSTSSSGSEPNDQASQGRIENANSEPEEDQQNGDRNGGAEEEEERPAAAAASNGDVAKSQREMLLMIAEEEVQLQENLDGIVERLKFLRELRKQILQGEGEGNGGASA